MQHSGSSRSILTALKNSRKRVMVTLGYTAVMDTNSILEQLKSERDRLESAIRTLEALNGSQRRSGRPVGSGKKKRVMSPEARAKIAAAARRRWASAKKAGKTNLAA
jgi:hypothetical protein